MAVMKKKGKKSAPAIQTSSLPDIIFMILFFFMVSTSMREVELLVKTKLPSASEVSKLEKKSLVSYIYIGVPTNVRAFGDSPRIQLNSDFKTEKEILDYVASEKDKMSEADRPQMTISLKIDERVRMGIVNDVKTELRRANALKVSYVASKEIRKSTNQGGF